MKKSPADAPEDRPLAKSRIYFREIDALYDLRGKVQLTPRKEIALDTSVTLQKKDGRTQLAFRSLEGDRWSNARGEWVSTPAEPLPDGCYQAVMYETNSVLQTFVREESAPIREKWIYVFAARNADGADPELKHELYAGKDGAFRAAKISGGDDRPLGGSQDAWIDVPRQVYAKNAWRHCEYFFHLAPERLSRRAIEVLAADIAKRAVLLGDPFHTDVLEGQERVPLALAKPEPAAFVVYLLDAIQEGLRRRLLYDEVLDARARWRPKEDACYVGFDDEYVLAKQIEAFTAGDASLRSLVDAQLSAYLKTTERKLREIQCNLVVIAQDLVAWIGREAFADVAIQGTQHRSFTKRGSRVVPAPLAFTERRSPSAFSKAVWDYDDAPPEIHEQIQLKATATQLRLSETDVGQDWLTRNFRVLLGEEARSSDGGLGMVVNPKSLANKVPSTALGLVLGAYADCWALQYKKDGLATFRNWLSVKYGFETAEARLPPAFQRKWSEYKMARRTPLAEVELDAAWKGKLETAKWAAKTWELGMKAVVYCQATHDLFHDPDLKKNPWAWAEWAGRTADIADSFISRAKEIDAAGAEWMAKKVQIKKLGGLEKLSVLKIGATAVTLAVRVRRLAKLRDEGDRDGEMIGMAGVAVMGIAEIIGGTTLVVGIAIAIGLALQWAGEKWKDHYNAGYRFLRLSQFGEPDALDKFTDTIDEPWFPRVRDPANPRRWRLLPASALKTDVRLQLQVLNQIKLDYEVDVFNRNRTLSVRIRPRSVGAVNALSKWTIEHFHVSEAGLEKIDKLEPQVISDNDDSTVLWAHIEDLAAAARVQPQQRRKPSIVTVRLDAFGDGKTIIERTAMESVGWYPT